MSDPGASQPRGGRDIPGELRDEDFAVELVRAYFADDPATGRARHSGAHFERLGGGGDLPEVAYQITAEDLLAVSRASPAQTLLVLFQADASPGRLPGGDADAPPPTTASLCSDAPLTGEGRWGDRAMPTDHERDYQGCES